MNESLSFDFDGETIAGAAIATFARHGLYVIRSFDLRSALAGQPACLCPHHGTAACNCQYAVLLVYGQAGIPAALTLHSHDGHTFAQIVRDSATIPDPRLAEQIMAALLEVGLTTQVASAATAPMTSDAD